MILQLELLVMLPDLSDRNFICYLYMNCMIFTNCLQCANLYLNEIC